MGEMIETPSKEEQNEKIQRQLTKSLVIGETWYLVCVKWMNCFKQFVGMERSGRNEVAHPGPIDNSQILDDNKELRKALVEKFDYEVIPSEGWNFLMQWYGLCEGQPPVARKVIEMAPGYLTIENYSLELKCYKNMESKNPVMLCASKADKVDKIITELKKRFGVNQNVDTSLVAFVDDLPDFCPSPKITLGAAGISSGSSLILKLLDNNDTSRRASRAAKANSSFGHFGPSVGASSSLSFAGGGRSSRSSSSSIGTASSNLSPREPGVCGLNNLGNTCFMNSVIQCMSNCPPITEFFLSNKHLCELNETNPLGMKGEIARVYGELIHAMWSGNYLTANPLPFKIQVGKFNPTFSGCQQHDSQELLTFLLDGLHEDLNRIKKKPYVEVKEQAGRSDGDLAKEAWDNYKRRNDSIIVDTFHGLLKSRVVCPECERVSVTFDPFCYLSLPLPLKKDRIISIRYVPFEGNKRECKYKVSVPRKGVIGDLCQELSARVVSCKPEQLLVAEVVHCHFHKFYCNHDSLDLIEEKDVIFVYQLPLLSPDELIVPVCVWEKVKPIDKFTTNHLFGVPLLVSIPRRNVSSLEIHAILKEKMKRHFIIHDNSYAINGSPNDGDNNAESSEFFPLFIVDTSRNTPTPEPLSFVNGVCDLRGKIEYNYNSRFFGRTMLIVQMTAEQRREFYSEKPAEFGHDLIVHPGFTREKSSRVKILDCISLFTTCEKLSADDAWYCPACKKHQRATKKFDLWKLPRILIIQLKRFSYTRGRRDKIDSLVEFPLNDLSIKNFVINTDCPDVKYDLIGVCNHYGSMGGGHYTAYCKNKNTDEWYCFDDNSVSHQPKDNIMTSAAYVLFYIAKESDFKADD